MKSRILFCSLLLLISNLSAMEMEQKQTTAPTAIPARARPATAADIVAHAHEAQEQKEPVVAPALPTPILFISSQKTEVRQAIYAIDPNAIQFSNMLTRMIEFRHHQEEQAPHIARKAKRQERSEAHVAVGTRRTETELQATINKNVITLDSPDTHVAFITELLNFLATEQFHTQKPAQYQAVIDFITEHTSNFATISFADVYTILDYFDIPIARNALLTMQDPLPLPTNAAQAIAYNEQLSIIFAAAQQDFINENNALTSNNTLLWQFFGRMLYPGCFANAKVSEMINFVLLHRDIEQLVLGAYMQQYPQLYHHPIKEFKAVIWPTVSPDGRMIAVQSGDDLDIRNIENWLLIRTIKNAFRAIFSPNGEIIAVYWSTPDRAITLINIHDLDNHPIQQFTDVSNVAFSPDGQTIAVEQGRNTTLINIYDGSTILTSVHSIDFSPDGGVIAVHSGRDINLINRHDGSIIKTFAKATKVVFSPNRKTIAVESKKGVDLINMHDWSIIRTFANARSPIFNPNGQIIAVEIGSTYSRNINLINTHDGSSIREIANVYDFSFNPNGQTIIVRQSATSLHLINIRDGFLATVFANTISVTFSPDGRIVIANQYTRYQLQGYVSLREALLSPLTPPIYIETPTEEDGEASEAPGVDTEEPVVLPAPLTEK